jgi:hypothetical protein
MRLNGREFSGIFFNKNRIPGESEKITELVVLINKNEKIDFSSKKKGETDVIATLLCRYLKSIEENFFSFDFVQKYLEIKKEELGKDEKNTKISSLLKNELPDKSFQFLNVLIRFLYQVYLNRSKNLMDSRNILTCIRMGVDENIQMNVSFEMRSYFIENYPDLFITQ